MVPVQQPWRQVPSSTLLCSQRPVTAYRSRARSHWKQGVIVAPCSGRYFAREVSSCRSIGTGVYMLPDFQNIEHNIQLLASCRMVWSVVCVSLSMDVCACLCMIWMLSYIWDVRVIVRGWTYGPRTNSCARLLVPFSTCISGRTLAVTGCHQNAFPNLVPNGTNRL